MTEHGVELFLEKCNSLGSKPGLETINELLEKLNNPQDKIPVLHIAGTNGKGSVFTFVASVLQEAGYRVGRYISPTISDYRERFQINGKMISKKDLAKQLEAMKSLCDKMEAEGHNHPTSFEMETALSFSYFLDKKCDVVLLETGMGGTLDATNVVKEPVLTVFSSISMDHMEYLGDTLEKIAKEKCGIMRNGVPVVSFFQEEEVMSVISGMAAEHHAPLCQLDKKDIKKIKYGLNKQSFYYKEDKYEISLAGTHQIHNAALAVCVVECLEKNFPVTLAQIKRGLLKAKWPGRLQVIGKNPLFVVDGAHNVDAAKKLMESIEIYFTNRKIIYIMGMFKDKEYEEVVFLTADRAEHIITVATPGNPRALPAYELAKVVREVNPNVTAADSIEEAVEISLWLAEKDTVVIAFGSLSFLGRLTQIVEKKTTVRSDTHGR